MATKPYVVGHVEIVQEVGEPGERLGMKRKLNPPNFSGQPWYVDGFLIFTYFTYITC